MSGQIFIVANNLSLMYFFLSNLVIYVIVFEEFEIQAQEYHEYMNLRYAP
jgi:hypothetical protein